jgi:hypothetical protein
MRCACSSATARLTRRGWFMGGAGNEGELIGQRIPWLFRDEPAPAQHGVAA